MNQLFNRTLLLLLLFSQTSFAGKDDCLQLIKSAYAKMDDSTLATSSKIKYMSFSIKTSLHQLPVEKESVSTSEVELIAGKGQSRYISKEVSVYQDHDNAFTVVPTQKKVYWSNSTMNLEKSKRAKTLQLMHDTLLKVCTVKECKKENDAALGYDQYIVLEPNAKAAEYFQMKQIAFYINSNTQELKKMIISYLPDNKIKSVEWTFHKTDNDYAAKDMEVAVKSIFMKGEELNAAYKEYQLVDNRKTK